MNKSKLELIEIAKCGVNLVVDGSAFSKLELIEIVKSIQEGCAIEITNCKSKSKLELKEIANCIKAIGRITFS
ncbi:hypothetical protein [Candidatus Methylobacter oryzae]|uniref:STAS domain-containing protein n=1 Tax=Candidatus Methylobacter oryzae TaxID=2497749 RepID=A0ABY3CBG1_9GAMM|nr:hypothetical protein [Candidatus Methylobacter oryzae]TRW96413.1 hypothetical protein EKO24_008760 [Candidatus Methylobacter oryzae]